MHFSIGQGLFVLNVLVDIDDGSIPPVFVLFDPDLFANSAPYCGPFGFFGLLRRFFGSVGLGLFLVILTVLFLLLFAVVIIVFSLVELVVSLPAVLF